MCGWVGGWVRVRGLKGWLAGAVGDGAGVQELWSGVWVGGWVRVRGLEGWLAEAIDGGAGVQELWSGGAVEGVGGVNACKWVGDEHSEGGRCSCCQCQPRHSTPRHATAQAKPQRTPAGR